MIRTHLPFVVLAALWACAGRAPGPEAAPAAEPAPSVDAAADPGAAADPAEAARQAAIADSTRNAFTPADVAFMAGMIHHHAQALTMSRLADDHGAGEPLRVLTARIINAQRDEIRLMQDWLRARGEPVPDPPEMHADPQSRGEARPHGAHPDHGDGAGADHALMPGMLTTGQMAALDAAYGEEWDRLFLRLMIQHHQGALTMVEELFATHGAAQEDAVFKLASDIGADQSSEITRMRVMLAEMVVAEDP